MWKNFKKGSLGIGSLHRWAKEDNPDKYNDMIMVNYENFIAKSLDGTDYKIATVFHRLYENNFVCESIKHKIVYEFRNHKWVKLDSSHSIITLMNKELNSLYEKYASIIYNKMLSLDDTTFEDKMEKKG